MKANKWKSMISILFVVGLPTFSWAEVHVASGARVTNMGTYAHGSMFVNFDKAMQGCPTARIDVPANHPAFKVTLATALSAKMTNKTLTIASDLCGQLNQNGDSYLLLE